MRNRELLRGLLVLGVLAAAPARAESGVLNVHLEPSAAVMLGSPQTTVSGYSAGLSGGLKADVALLGPLAAQLGVAGLVFPTSLLAKPGSAMTAGAGLRVRVLDDKGGYLLHAGAAEGHRGNIFGNLWLDAQAMLVGTGNLLRFGFEAGAGVELSLVDGVSVGPMVRYAHVVQPQVEYQTPGDAHIVLLGASMSFAVPSNGVHVPDSDGDGMDDDADACPQLRGVTSDDAKKNGCPADSDADGIPDAQDACAALPGVQSDNPHLNGCPKDSDGDGVADVRDDCPQESGVESSRPGKNGCPADRDDDGIPDGIDACPGLAGLPSDDAKKNGCPKDTDGDRIPDVNDACPLVAGVASTTAALNGCPPDSDGDGVPDSVDACPAQQGPTSSDAKRNGCPDKKVKAFVTPEKIVITERVFFEFNRYRILPRSFPMLDTVAYLMRKHAELKKVRIDGHTDDVGSDEANQALSEKRAQAVLAYLVKQGIAPERLEAKGFGKTKPLVAGDTEQARDVNRRVEFLIEERADLFQGEP